jgi:hypothetical protein
MLGTSRSIFGVMRLGLLKPYFGCRKPYSLACYECMGPQAIREGPGSIRETVKSLNGPEQMATKAQTRTPEGAPQKRKPKEKKLIGIGSVPRYDARNWFPQ